MITETSEYKMNTITEMEEWKQLVLQLENYCEMQLDAFHNERYGEFLSYLNLKEDLYKRAQNIANDLQGLEYPDLDNSNFWILNNNIRKTLVHIQEMEGESMRLVQGRMHELQGKMESLQKGKRMLNVYGNLKVYNPRFLDQKR